MNIVLLYCSRFQDCLPLARPPLKAAKRRGVHVGRPRKLAPDQLDMAAQLIAGDRSQREVAKALGVAVSTLREGMKGQAAERKRPAATLAAGLFRDSQHD